MTSVTVTNESACTVNKSRVSKPTIELATLSDWKDKASPLFQEHYEEIARNKELMQLDVNWPLYEELNNKQALFVYLAMQDNVCIGYSLNLITYHLHYAELKYTQNDVLFIKKNLEVDV